MKKEVFKVKYNGSQRISSWGLKLYLRSLAKEKLDNKYFSKIELGLGKGPKNFGCFVFGQKDAWKGIINIWPNENETEFYILYDAYRAFDREKEIEEFLNTLADYLAKEKGFEVIKTL